VPPNRLILKARLTPAIGERFQPTGFPDLGPAEYLSPSGTTSLLVESPQSMANRLEDAIWDPVKQELVPALHGMPYVRLSHRQHGLVTSLSEPHRLASPYLLPMIKDQLIAEWGWDHKRQLRLAELAPPLFRRDPNSLIHGVYFALIKPGNLRIPRLLSAFIEATQASPALSGGVKLDRIDARADDQRGMGHIPFSRREYVSPDITAAFTLDLVQLRHYGLSDVATGFLHDLALYKIRLWLENGLRLRTACDFQVTEAPDLPTEKALAGRLAKAITKLQKSGEFPPAPGIWELSA
jgi:CRISPR-associated protein Csb1